MKVDITERKKLKEKLKVSEANLRKEMEVLHSILESMSDGVVVADLDGRFLLFNKASEKFGGTRSYDMTESEWIKNYGFFYPDTGKKLKIYETPLVRSINGEILNNIELMARSADGKDDIYILANSRPLKDSENNIIGALAVYRDISERVKNERIMRETTGLLREFVNKLQNAREEERAIISKEIHDELGQALTAIKLDLTWLSKKISPGNREAKEKIISTSELIDRTVDKVRKISSDLRPGVLDELGIIAAIEWQVSEFKKRAQIKIKFDCKITSIKLDKVKSIALFRIVQESLTNVARHSNATAAKINLDKDDRYIYLSIEDNGDGIKEKNLFAPNAIGILGMKERVLKLNGYFSIRRVNKTNGTLVKVLLPV